MCNTQDIQRKWFFSVSLTVTHLQCFVMLSMLCAFCVLFAKCDKHKNCSENEHIYDHFLCIENECVRECERAKVASERGMRDFHPKKKTSPAQNKRTNDKKVPANHQMLIKNIMNFFPLFIRLFSLSFSRWLSFILSVRTASGGGMRLRVSVSVWCVIVFVVAVYSALYFIPSTHHCVTMINYSWKSVYHSVSVYLFFEMLLSSGCLTMALLLVLRLFCCLLALAFSASSMSICLLQSR